MKILIVDDELVSRTKMRTILGKIGDCDCVEDGHSAIASFAAALAIGRPYDLVTLDIGLQGMNGTEVLWELRERERTGQLAERDWACILMVTSHSDRDNVVTAITAGCNGYIIKPFNRDKVLNQIDKAGLPARQRRAAAFAPAPPKQAPV